MKKLLLIMSTIIMIASSLPQGRMGWSSDGNTHDGDDMIAVAMALVMASKAGAGPKVTVFVHSDHVWYHSWDPSEVRIPIMQESVYGAISRWGGFPNINVYTGETETAAAVDALKNEINKSTASDPFWLASGGPMEIVGLAIEAADPSKRQYCKLVSHSSWNRSHAADSHGSRFTWSYITSLGCQGIIIRDQNGGFATHMNNVSWMQNSSDADIRWLFERFWPARPWLYNNDVYDGSDSGMFWYILFDDENGDFNDFKVLIESDTGPTPEPTVSPEPTAEPTPPPTPEAGAIVHIEAENYSSMSGIQLTGGGSAVGWVDAGDWCAYNMVGLNQHTVFEANTASALSGGNIEIRLGSPTGTLIGTCTVGGTGSWTTYQTFTSSINNTSGVHDIYLVFSGGYDVNWIEFSGDSGPTPEPTDEPTPEPTDEPTPEPTDEPTPGPTAEPTEEPTPGPTGDPNANLLVNGDFSSGTDNWGTWSMNAGGSSLAEVGGQGVLTITSGGSANWEVSLYQDGVTIESGKDYTVLVDLRSPGFNKEVTVKVRETTTWTAYGSTSVTLGTIPFMHTVGFTFTAPESNPNAQFIIECGGNNDDLIVDNVGVYDGTPVTPTPGPTDEPTATPDPTVPPTATADPTVSPTAAPTDEPTATAVPTATPDGENLLQNGDFTSGTDNWGTWSMSAGGSSLAEVGGEGVLTITSGGNSDWEVSLYQDGVNIESGKDYTVQLDMRSAGGSKDLLVKVRETVNWTAYGSASITVDGWMQTYAFTFTAPESNPNAQFIIECGGNEVDLIVDNVGVYDGTPVTPTPGPTDEPTATPDPTVPPTPTAEPTVPTYVNLIQNGGFSSGTDNWGTWSMSSGGSSLAEVGGEGVLTITDGGSQDWQVTLYQDGLNMEAGKLYAVKLDMRTTGGSKDVYVYVRETLNWGMYDRRVLFTVNGWMQTFEYTFGSPEDNANAQFVIECGGNNVDLIVDNVAVYEIQVPVTPEPTSF